MRPHTYDTQVGAIYQSFSSLEEGRVRNIIEVVPCSSGSSSSSPSADGADGAAGTGATPPPLLAGSSATLVVEAAFEARTQRSIALSFRCGWKGLVGGRAGGGDGGGV